MPNFNRLPNRRKTLYLLKNGKRPDFIPGSEVEAAWLGLERLYRTKKLPASLGNIDKRIAQTVQSPNHSIQNLSWKQLLVAASILILFISLSVSILPSYNTISSESWYTHLPVALPNLGQERGMSSIQNKKQKAVATYENYQYAKAIPLFEAYLTVTPSDQKIRMYFGITLLMEKQYGKAEEMLSIARSMMYSPELKPSCTWYLTLAYYYQHKYDKALYHLQEIIRSPKHPYRSDALAMLALI
ncbi:MAG: hypothetical protein HRU40_14550 [Saprospiraceae bacterium]|nr:hypothetical protein [Saprospiraceae bacterium]